MPVQAVPFIGAGESCPAFEVSRLPKNRFAYQDEPVFAGCVTFLKKRPIASRLRYFHSHANCNARRRTISLIVWSEARTIGHADCGWLWSRSK